MKKIESRFETFALPKETTKKIKGGENMETYSSANTVAITDPLRKKDKK